MRLLSVRVDMLAFVVAVFLTGCGELCCGVVGVRVEACEIEGHAWR